SEIAAAIGSQNLILAIDAKSVRSSQFAALPTGRQVRNWNVFTHGGRKDSGLDVLEWVKQGEKLGAGEILLTSMDTDGTKKGFDIPLTAAVSEAVKIPIIASGGAGSAKHFLEVFQKTSADAALAASIFHFKETSIGAIKKFLAENKIPVRIMV
ncbi:MAG: HisA/HisF-related TIM barrel protein, partial [Patescibacteria group bacterium]